MSSNKKKQNKQPAAQPAPQPASAEPPKSDGGAGRLGLLIAVAGIAAVLVIGGVFVYLNSSAPPPGPPPLAQGWAAGPVNMCRGSPQFPLKLGFSRAVVFSTSERLNKGLELIEPGPNNDLSTGRHYQDPSWTAGGYLGVFVADRNGNVYLAPSPRISLIDNPPDKANILYKVDTNTGVMSKWIDLPAAAVPSPENPYGILALAYDCDTNSLYVSTVKGSTRDKPLGRIYQVDVASGKVLSEFDNTDAFGVGVFNQPEGKRLYFGSARQPEVYSIALDDKGNFWGTPRLEFVLNGAYNRPRRIEFDQRGNMLVRGIDFNFTLAATSEDRRTDYIFQYDPTAKKWVQVQP